MRIFVDGANAYLLERGRKTGRLPEDFRLDQARHVFRVYKANVRAAPASATWPRAALRGPSRPWAPSST